VDSDGPDFKQQTVYKTAYCLILGSFRSFEFQSRTKQTARYKHGQMVCNADLDSYRESKVEEERRGRIIDIDTK